MRRRDFIKGAAAGAIGFPSLLEAVGKDTSAEARQSELISYWDRETELVSPKDYLAYQKDGDTRSFKALEECERAFDKVVREVSRTVVTGDKPAIWSVYNMGYLVKTRKALFSIDLRHRRDCELVPMLDFALITHNHGDHWRRDFYRKMNEAGKLVMSNFLTDNAQFNKMKGASVKGVGTYRVKDVEIRTSLIDHFNQPWGIDFTMAYEMKIGDFRLYHTGDSGLGTVPKLNTVWGRPDLWLFFPGCGINTPEAVKKVCAKRIVFGHLWELEHLQAHRGRFDEALIRARLADAKAAGCKDVSVAFWGDRIE